MNICSVAYKLELTKYLCAATTCVIRTGKYSTRIPTHDYLEDSFHVISQTLRTNTFKSRSCPSILINKMH